MKLAARWWETFREANVKSCLAKATGLLLRAELSHHSSPSWRSDLLSPAQSCSLVHGDGWGDRFIHQDGEEVPPHAFHPSKTNHPLLAFPGGLFQTT